MTAFDHDDVVLIFEASDDEMATTLLLHLGAAGKPCVKKLAWL